MSCLSNVLTCWESIDRSNNWGENSVLPSSGSKNCPTAMEAAGGGLPEKAWVPQSHCMYIAQLNNFHITYVGAHQIWQQSNINMQNMNR